MSWAGRIVVLVLLAATLAVPFLFAPPVAAPPTGTPELIIISPHSESIKYEFSRAFSEWHRTKHGTAVRLEFRDIGGSSEISRFLASEYKIAGRDGGVGIDVIWGGGAFDFRYTYAANGYLEPYPREQLEQDEPGLFAHLPHKPEALVKLDENYESYDLKYRWYGACLSSFGIVYNRLLCRRLGIEPPTRWKDLADERLFTQLGLGDPTQSGSIAKCYHTVASTYPWAEAMWILRRMGANARYFTSSASRVPQDVGLPDIAAGVAIDYYALSQADVYADHRLEFVPALDAPSIDTDPIGILRGAPHPQLARRFVQFVLSRAGQRLWAFRVGAPGGPQRHPILRPPIRTDLYTPEEMAHFAHPWRSARDAGPQGEQLHPLDIYALARQAAERDRPPGARPPSFGRFRVLVRHMIIEPHQELVEAWRLVIRHGRRHPELTRLFDRVVVTAEELGSKRVKAAFADPLEQVRLRNDWTRRFRASYQQVVDRARALGVN
jgi:ABC-type Fe3+ transport system substrate-binding protein